MGEAKRRKLNDPLYGIVSQKDRFRGIVVSSPIHISGQALHIKSSNLDTQELRFSLFFWDKLVWPSSRAIYLESNDDESSLEDIGVLERPEYTFDGDGAQGMINTHIAAFKDLSRLQPQAWSLAGGEKSLLIDGGLASQDTGTQLDLLRSIPIPKEDVPLEEILEFKERRKNELILLRSKIDQLSARVSKAESKDEELKKCISEIDQACANLMRCSSEWQLPVYLSDFKVSLNFNIANAGLTASGAYATFSQFSQELAITAGLIGGLQSTVNITPNEMGLRGIKKPPNPFRYAYQIHAELPW